MRAQASVHDVRLQAPLRPTGGEPTSRPLVLLRVVDGDGVVGHGEAAPLEDYDGVSVGACPGGARRPHVRAGHERVASRFGRMGGVRRS